MNLGDDFKKFVLSELSEIPGSESMSPEQINSLISSYCMGFECAIRIMKAENVIKIQTVS